jgi:putative PIN family toxin of toxin-antitoxin system
MSSRAVFDCMVFLQGAGRPAGPARACFRLVDEGRVTLCLSAEILTEVRDVLTRPKTLRKFPLLSLEWVETFVQNAEAKAVVPIEVPRTFTLPRDPKDEPYLNLAIAVGAEYLVSRDKDLLDLMHDESFRQRYPELTILDPVAFLQAVADQGQPEQAKQATPG